MSSHIKNYKAVKLPGQVTHRVGSSNRQPEPVERLGIDADLDDKQVRINMTDASTHRQTIITMSPTAANQIRADLSAALKDIGFGTPAGIPREP